MDSAVLKRLDRIADALEGIRHVLETITQPDAREPAMCTHPDDQRVVFGGMGQLDGFQCKACGVVVDPVPVTGGA